MKQTPAAKQFWNTIAGPIQVKLLNNVWCGDCRDVSSVAVETMNIEKGDLIIKGKCTKCNGAVARLIEGDGRPEKKTKKALQVSIVDFNPDISKLTSFRAKTKAAEQIKKVKTLAIESFGEWSPREELFEDIDDEQEEFSHPYDKILHAGKRSCWEMENILPGYNPENFDCPIGDGIEIMNTGDWYGAIQHMKNLLAQDERCLDAYAHLGNWYFEDEDLSKAKNFYKMGTAIGLKSISNKINDVFPWGVIENRPFLRCLHGLGITLYRQRNVVDAMSIFQKIVWLNPRDNQGARFLIDSLVNGVKWEDCV